MTEDNTKNSVSDADFIAIQRFQSHEAALLDQRRFREWHALLTDDVTYRVSAQVVRDSAAGNLEFAFIDEDAVAFKARVDQVSNPKLTHAENPPSLTRRFVSGLQASYGEAGEFHAKSSILIYRSRPSLHQEGFYVGERRDLIRRTEGGLRIARREVRLDQALLDGAVSILF
jgi:3-phenylpropionate/cinnamic acid dioxygenase small subunit